MQAGQLCLDLCICLLALDTLSYRQSTTNSVFGTSLLVQLVYRSVSQASLSTACPVQTLSLS